MPFHNTAQLAPLQDRHLPPDLSHHTPQDGPTASARLNASAQPYKRETMPTPCTSVTDGLTSTLTETTAAQPARKKRCDAGKPHGPHKPRKASPVTRMDNGVSLIGLTGRHGTGKQLRVSTADLPDLLAFTDNGTRLQVVMDGTGKHPTLRLNGPNAQRWQHSENTRDLVTVARFLVGETHGGRRIRCKDHDPFNLTRDNLEVLVPAIEETFPIDWEKAVTDRQAKMQGCCEGQTIHQPQEPAGSLPATA